MAVYGGSINQLAANEQQMALAKRAERERALANLVRGIEMQRDRELQERVMLQRRGDVNQQQMNFQQQMGANAAHEARMSGQFDIEQNRLGQQARQGERERRMRMLESRRKFTLDKQEAELRLLLKPATEMADEGMFDSVESVVKAFPTLSTQAPAIAARSLATRKALEGELQNTTADANLLNEAPAEMGRLQHMATVERDTSWNPDNNRWWRPNQPDTEAIGRWSSQAGAIRAAQEGVSRVRDRMSRLQADPSGRYTPAMTLPWQRAGGAPTVTAPSAPTQDTTAILQEAQRAISAGKDPAAVRQRLIQMGIQPNF